MKKWLWVILPSLCLALLAGVTSLAPTAGAETGKRIMLILDASGSMWGQIQGTAKIVTAREVMSDLVRDLPSNLEVGLTVYGHRHEGDCNDVEEMQPPGPLDRDNLIFRIRAIKPKGKTPIAHSISLVADKLKAMGGGGAVILVSDGEETCGGDPCKLVADLKAAGVEFVMHVVGFDVKGPVSEQLACIAKAGGGTYTEAGNAARLKEALTSVIQKTLAENLVVRAVQTSIDKKKKPAAIDALVTVFKDGSPVAENSGLRVGFKLEPGIYDLEVAIPSLGQDKKLEKIEVNATTITEKEVAFSVSALGVLARDSNGKTIDVFLKIGDRESDQPVATGWSGTESPRLFPLPAGTYAVEITEQASGQQMKLDDIMLTDGQEVMREVSFAIAHLAATARDSAGKAINVSYDVLTQSEPPESIKDGWSGTDEPQFVEVPPGTYNLKVRENQTEQELLLKDVTLEPGARVVKEVSFALAKVAVTARDSAGKAINVSYDVLTQSEPPERIKDGWSGTDEPQFVEVPPGTYNLKVRENQTEQELLLKDVTLEPGARVVKEVSFALAKVAVTARDSAGKAINVSYDVLTQSEPPESIKDGWSGTGEPQFVEVPPGTYNLKVRENQSEQELLLKDVTLEPGARVVKEVSF